jgi:hypothetical protein
MLSDSKSSVSSVLGRVHMWCCGGERGRVVRGVLEELERGAVHHILTSGVGSSSFGSITLMLVRSSFRLCRPETATCSSFPQLCFVHLGNVCVCGDIDVADGYDDARSCICS